LGFGKTGFGKMGHNRLVVQRLRQIIKPRDCAANRCHSLYLMITYREVMDHCAELSALNLAASVPFL